MSKDACTICDDDLFYLNLSKDACTICDDDLCCSALQVANLMAIEDLIDLGCTAVADKIRGKTPDEIRVALDIENDYTPEQEAEVRRENAWAFED